MINKIAKSIGIGIMLILSIAIVILAYYATIVPTTCPEDEYITPQIDTVEVIIECDGDKEIRWYTLDTINSIK
jgi:hypothetical protein